MSPERAKKPKPPNLVAQLRQEEIRDDDLWDESIEKEAADQSWLTKRVDRLKADARRRA